MNKQAKGWGTGWLVACWLFTGFTGLLPEHTAAGEAQGADSATFLSGRDGVALATGSDTQPVGASVEELLQIARQMNPEVAAAALDADAAAARVKGADALPDSKLLFTFDDISKSNSGWPGRVGTYKYTLQQEIPGWGKRESKRQIAEAGSREANSQLEERITDLLMRVKAAYADYHRVHLSMDQTRELLQIMRVVVVFARARYAQGMALQAEATSAEAERGALSSELVRLEKERHRLRVRLNALLNRHPDAPLVEHPHLRPLPAAQVLDYETLWQRAQAANPALKMAQAKVEGSTEEIQLARKNWLPDLEVGVGLVNPRQEGGRDGYEAMLSLNLPLQTGWRVAAEQEAVAKQQAASARLNLAHLQLAANLREALLSLEESRAVEKSTVDILLPQARIALHSALKGYEAGSVEAVTVLDAIQRLKKFHIEQIQAQFEQQVRLAEIERLIGGDL
ncbi:MAG: TolC family protein [Magnetococcales bacterium]|nr:TolC family protein [Magnetococcales bacterium]MBF0114254.1 TolC family protein [Magnetococcales bacterium]